MSMHQTIFGMSPNAKEVLWQLFRNGPTHDGDICTKAGRGELFDLGYASRVNGWSYLTQKGMEIAVCNLLFGDRKESWDNERRRKTA
jgi:hypothetical protein